MNFARVRATERYLSHSCDEVFVVADIARACTNASVQEILRRCKPNQPKRIICTKSEVLVVVAHAVRWLLISLLRPFQLKNLLVVIVRMLFESNR